MCFANLQPYPVNWFWIYICQCYIFYGPTFFCKYGSGIVIDDQVKVIFKRTLKKHKYKWKLGNLFGASKYCGFLVPQSFSIIVRNTIHLFSKYFKRQISLNRVWNICFLLSYFCRKWKWDFPARMKWFDKRKKKSNGTFRTTIFCEAYSFKIRSFSTRIKQAGACSKNRTNVIKNYELFDLLHFRMQLCYWVVMKLICGVL